MITLFLTPVLLLFALLSYSQHRTAIILLAGLLPSYLLRFSIFGIPTNFLELAIVIVALTSFIQPAVRSRWITAWRCLPFTFTILVLLFILASSISAYISPHPYTSLGILKSWVVVPIIFGWLVYSIGFNNLKIENCKLKIINAILISGVVVSIIGLLQTFTLERIKSIYDVPNSLALFLAPLLIIALWQKRWFLAAPLAAALLATQSVSGLLAVALTILLGTIFWAHPSVRKRSLAALILLIVLATAYLFSTGRLNYLAHSPNSVSVRLQLWSISWELIKEHPVLGIGLGTFEPAYQQKLHERFFTRRSPARPAGGLGEGGPLPPPIPEFVFRDPHNWILSFWLNTGLLGLLSFAGLNLWVIRQPRVARWGDPGRGTPSTQCDCGRRPGRKPARQDPRRVQAIILALLALVLFGLADTIYWKNDLAALYWVLIALLIAKTPKK